MANGANVSIKCVTLTIFQRWGTSTVECILKKYLLTFHISYFGQINPSPIHPVAVQTKFEDLLQRRVKKDKGLSNWMPIKKKKALFWAMTMTSSFRLKTQTKATSQFKSQHCSTAHQLFNSNAGFNTKTMDFKESSCSGAWEVLSN